MSPSRQAGWQGKLVGLAVASVALTARSGPDSASQHNLHTAATLPVLLKISAETFPWLLQASYLVQVYCDLFSVIYCMGYNQEIFEKTFKYSDKGYYWLWLVLH